MPLCLRWFKVIPLAPWATLWWLHWMIILETAHFLGRMTGWFSSSVKFDFLKLPPTRRMPLLSRNGSNWLIPLLSGTIFFSDFSCLISLASDSACTKRKIFCVLSGSFLCHCYHLAGSKLRPCQFCLTKFILLSCLMPLFFSSLSNLRLSVVALIIQSYFECWNH